MRIYYFILLLWILTFIACHSSVKKEYKLSDEQLAHLMLDLQFAEVSLPDMKSQHQDSIKTLIDQRLEEIYHLSNAEIKNEIDQLQTDPEKLKWVVDRVKEMVDSIQQN